MRTQCCGEVTGGERCEDCPLVGQPFKPLDLMNESDKTTNAANNANWTGKESDVSDTVRVPRELLSDLFKYGQLHPIEGVIYNQPHALCLERLDLLLSAAPQSSDGWIPLEPTKEMIEAGAQRLVRWETGKEIWPTLLQAPPRPRRISHDRETYAAG